MRKVIFMVAILITVIAISITSPYEEKHKSEIIKKYKNENPISGL